MRAAALDGEKPLKVRLVVRFPTMFIVDDGNSALQVVDGARLDEARGDRLALMASPVGCGCGLERGELGGEDDGVGQGGLEGPGEGRGVRRGRSDGVLVGEGLGRLETLVLDAAVDEDGDADDEEGEGHFQDLISHDVACRAGGWLAGFLDVGHDGGWCCVAVDQQSG
jgi:hypothetical protein